MKNIVLYGILFLLLTFNCFSQGKDKSVAALKKAAIDYEEIGDVYSAIENYTEFLEKKPTNAYYSFRLAKLYQQIRDYENAEKYYKQAYLLKKEKDPVSLFYYALMQKMNGKYDEAESNFIKARKGLKSAGKQAILRKAAKTEIEGCLLAKKLRETPLNMEIVQLSESVNNPHIDYSPFPINDSTFYYSSVVSKKAAEVINFIENRPVYSRFYLASKSGATFTGRIEVKDSFNIKDRDVGNGTICSHGNRFYFTICNRNNKNNNHCEIYYSELVRNKWTNPESVGKMVNNPQYTSTQPTVGIESRQNREVLYFVSDRPGGRGGLDIWYSIYDKESNTYLEPKNLGGKINTTGDEMTPFYNQDNRKLYFSSNGHTGLGGMDIFRSNGELKKFEEPMNVGFPLNSNADELYYVLNPNQSSGYFVSNRKGAMVLEQISCCDDIFYFKYKDYIDIIAKGKIIEMDDSNGLQYIEKLVKTTGDLKLENAHFLEKAIVSLWLISAKTPNEKFIVKIDSTGKDGSYNFNIEAGNKYLLTVEKDGYFRRQTEIITTGITTDDTIYNNFVVYKISEKPIIIKNIYYPFDKSFLTDTAKAIIDSTIYELMKENPQIIAEISSHTDSKGSDDYNVKLSQKRAQSVVDYLVSKGISKERLQAKGYGEAKPIAANEKPDKTDNPEGRQKNRRTEFRVIGMLPQYSEIKYEE